MRLEVRSGQAKRQVSRCRRSSHWRDLVGDCVAARNGRDCTSGSASASSTGSSPRPRLRRWRKSSTRRLRPASGSIAVMGGETALAAIEVVRRGIPHGRNQSGRFGYRLVTSKTSTMQKELQGAADEGFRYRGRPCSVGLRRRRGRSFSSGTAARRRPVSDYRLVATSKTATLQKRAGAGRRRRLSARRDDGWQAALGGNELVAITRRVREQ